MNGQFRFGEITPLKYFLAIGLVLVCLFTFIGEDEHLLSSFIRWSLQVLLPLMLIIAVHVFFNTLTVFSRLNAWVKLCLSGITGALIFSPLALAFDVISGLESLAGRHVWTAIGEEFINIVAPMTIAWMAMNAPWVLGYQIKKIDDHDRHNNAQTTKANNEHQHTHLHQIQNQSKNQSKNQTLNQAEFYTLIPKEIRSDIVFLKSELHYLLVKTSMGKALVLYNLKDAVQAIEPNLGIQPHRSYWIAYAAIKSFKKQGRQGTLILIDGSEIPVSRHRMSDLASVIEKRVEKE